MEDDLQERQGVVERALIRAGNLRGEPKMISPDVRGNRSRGNGHLFHGFQAVQGKGLRKGAINDDIPIPVIRFELRRR